MEELDKILTQQDQKGSIKRIHEIIDDEVLVIA